MHTTRNLKDTVFTTLFNNEKRLIELYNALEGKNLSYDTYVNINTLENVLCDGLYNDISFEIDNRFIVLIEHQSTINQNIPLRLLLYVARLYEKITNKNKTYKEKLLEIPTPEFFVLYNGQKKFPDKQILKLSDAFIDKSKKPQLELTVKILNINKDHNKDILNKSKTLNDYSTFINEIRKKI